MIQQPGKSNSAFYVGGPVTSGTDPNLTLTDESLDISPRPDSEPQSLMGVRFACHTLENAMPLIIAEVHFEGRIRGLAAS